MHQRTLLGLGASAAAALALVPAGASAQVAPTVSVTPGACISGISGIETPVTVAGYPANTVVSIDPGTGGGGGSILTDATGAGTDTLGISNAVAGQTEAFTDSTLTFTPGASAGLPPIVVPVRFINAGAARNGRSTGSPRRTITWSFAGFAQEGQTIYGHVRYKGKTVRNYRFGTAAACGALSKKAPSLPVSRSALKTGSYTIQFDTSRTYKRNTDFPTYKTTVFLRPVRR